MPSLTRIALRKQIAAGETGPLYLLIGEDDIEKSAVASEFAEMVDEGLRAFSMDRLFGGEIKADDLFDAAATLPMMAPRRIVIVFDAERLLIPKREGKAADAEQERLEAFVKKPPQHATVVLVCGPLDQRRRLVKLLLKEAQVVDCGSINDSADAERWVKARAERDKVPIDGAAVRVLVERAGIDLVRLRSGLERVALYAMGQPKITADDVKQVVAPTAEATNFRDCERDRAQRRRRCAARAGARPGRGRRAVLPDGAIAMGRGKMPPARLKHAIAAVFRTDEAIKSSGATRRFSLNASSSNCALPRARGRLREFRVLGRRRFHRLHRIGELAIARLRDHPFVRHFPPAHVAVVAVFNLRWICAEERVVEVDEPCQHARFLLEAYASTFGRLRVFPLITHTSRPPRSTSGRSIFGSSSICFRWAGRLYGSSSIVPSGFGLCGDPAARCCRRVPIRRSHHTRAGCRSAPRASPAAPCRAPSRKSRSAATGSRVRAGAASRCRRHQDWRPAEPRSRRQARRCHLSSTCADGDRRRDGRRRRQARDVVLCPARAAAVNW